MLLFELRHFDFLILTAILALGYSTIGYFLWRHGRLDRFLIWGAVILAFSLPAGWYAAGHAELLERKNLRQQYVGLPPNFAIELSILGHTEFNRSLNYLIEKELAENPSIYDRGIYVDPEVRPKSVFKLMKWLVPNPTISEELAFQSLTDAKRYKSMIEAIQRWLRTNQTILDIFTVRKGDFDPQYRIVVDSKNDFDQDGTYGEVGPPNEMGKRTGERFDRSVSFDLKLGITGFDESVKSDERGNWISAYAPIMSPTGKFDSIVAVDYPAEPWIRSIMSSRFDAIVRLFTFATLSLGGIAFIGMLRADVRASALKEEELRSANHAAELAAEEAKRATEAKTQFLANMSHEIRTPMNGVLGMSEVLLQTDLTNEQRQYQNLLQESARSLLDLINDILDFSKIEAGKVELELIPVDPHELAAQALQSLGRRASEKDLELILRVDETVPLEILSDPTRIRQILINLVTNAIKFTRQGEIEVHISLARSTKTNETGLESEEKPSANELLVSVRDTGIGIPPSQQSKIFEAFTQADASTTRDYGGTGLGLSICSGLTRLLGGRLWLESEVGKGSKFSFQIPFSPANRNAISADGNFAGLRVLVVDDNATNRLVYTEILQREGFAVETAIDGRVALQALIDALAGSPFDLVLLDVMMPGLDGYQVASSIASHQALKAIPVIMLSSMDKLVHDTASAEQVIRRQLFKPASRRELLSAVRDALNTNSSERVSKLEKIARTQHPKRILLADDAAVNRKVAQSLLELRGHQVTLAVDGEQAVELWQKGQYDLILMDVQMPRMDGFAATQRIRKEESNRRPRTPIVAMTAHAMRGDRERCIEQGMDGYLAKPFKHTDMFELVENLGIAHEFCSVNSESVVDRELDIDALLENSGGEREIACQMVEIFLEEVNAQIKSVERSVAGKSGSDLANAAHLLRGSVALFGAKNCVSALRALEQVGKSQKFESAENHASCLSKAMHQLLRELREFDSLSTSAKQES